MTRPTVDYDPETRPRDASEVAFAFRAFGLNSGRELCAPVSSSQVIGSLPQGHEPIVSGALDRVFRLEWRDGADAPVGRRGHSWVDKGKFSRFASTLEEAVEYAGAVIEHHVAGCSPGVHAGVVTWWEGAPRPHPSLDEVATLISRRIDLGGVRLVWPEPIGATIYLGAPFNAFPRPPLQLASCLRRVVVYGASHMPVQGAAWLQRRRAAGKQ